MAGLDPGLIEQRVRQALEEDVGTGDLTSVAIIPVGRVARGQIVARERLVVAGLEVAETVFRLVDPAISCRRLAREGEGMEPGAVLLEVQGPAVGILTAERVALNFLQRLCGVATLTRRFVDAVAGTGARILDTRKTTPGLRLMEKHAVACGGGVNHRVGLFDAVLIKDNHLATLDTPNAVGLAVQMARNRFPGCSIEVEADTLTQVDQALAAGADILLLDNMTLDQLREAVRRVGRRARTEASGGITLDTVRAVAETGVDRISVGQLTHSARAVDLALDFLSATSDVARQKTET